MNESPKTSTKTSIRHADAITFKFDPLDGFQRAAMRLDGWHRFAHADGRVSYTKVPTMCPTCGKIMSGDADIAHHETADRASGLCDPSMP